MNLNTRLTQVNQKIKQDALKNDDMMSRDRGCMC